MCNAYRLKVPLQTIFNTFSDTRIPLRFSRGGGGPNLEAKDYRITDRAPIVRMSGEAAELGMMRWSWPGPTGAPVFNFRSEGRRISAGQRCLIPTDGFYEFTASETPGDRKKTRWLFTAPGAEVFAIAGVWRAGAAKGEDAWSMLTCEPGPDVAAFHNRQVVVLKPDAWAAWLGGADEAGLLSPSPAGTLVAERAAS